MYVQGSAALAVPLYGQEQLLSSNSLSRSHEMRS